MGRHHRDHPGKSYGHGALCRAAGCGTGLRERIFPEDTIPFIQRVAKPSTIVIPVLNIYGTGAKMQEQLPKLLVTDGCIYVSANIKNREY